MVKKLCKKCGVEKPLEEMLKKYDGYGDGYQFLCKQCKSKYNKQYHKQYYKKNKKRIATYSKRHYVKNKKAISIYNKQRYKKCKKEINKRGKEYYRKHKKEISIRKKQYRIENKEKYIIYQKRWRKSEHGKNLHRLCERRRNQHKKNLATDHDLTNDEWQHILESQDNRCVGITKKGPCNRSFKRFKSEADHIYPLELGGLFVKENVQALCRRCNSSKGIKTMKEWRKSINI